MLDFEDDMATVFFGTDFAHTFTRQRPGVADVDVVGILGVEDVDALQDRVRAPARTLRMPASADVRADDVLVAVQAIPALRVAAGDRFRLLEVPQRVNDGAEMEALLGSAPA